MNINVRLSKNFTTTLNRLLGEHGTEMAKLNGLSDDILSYTDFIDNFIDKQAVADASIDGSANVGQKDIVSLLGEMPKPHQKLLAWNKIFYEINKRYGYKAATRWLQHEYEGYLYLHDANTSTFFSYCYAYDLKDLAERGLFFIENFNPEPAKHLTTFVDFVKEFVSYCANRTAGAVGLPNLIPYMYYFWREDIKDDYYVKTPERYAKQEIQRLIYSLNQPWVRGSIQSAFTNVSFFDREYLEAIFGGAKFPDGSYMLDDIEEIMTFQKLFMKMSAQIRSKNMMTYPVQTISLLRVDHKFIDEEFAEFSIRHNMYWNDSNFFIDDDITSLSSCCRMKNVVDMDNIGYMNSIGGSALRVGSIKVGTINLARIAYEVNSEEEYLERLKETVIVNLQGLDRIRHIIKRNVEKGLLPNFAKDLITFDTCYNTIGVTANWEAIKTFGYYRVDEFGNTFYTDEAFAFGEKLFKTIHETKEQWRIDNKVDYKINIEQIPGEAAAAKLMKKDEFFHPDKVVKDLPLYGNQFIPLGIKTTLEERVRIAAAFDSYCNGGSILHASIDAPFKDYETARKMVEYIADKGVTYFAFNTQISACEKNHGFYGSKCPECGGDVVTTYQRIVGFLVPTKTYSKERKAELSMREWHDINNTSLK